MADHARTGRALLQRRGALTVYAAVMGALIGLAIAIWIAVALQQTGML
jgi:hypothetical protein